MRPRPTRPALVATACTLVAGLLLPLTAGTAGATPVAAAAGDDTLDVLVLGDSYSAGNGATDERGAAQTYGPAGCLRSRVAWGETYAAALRETGRAVRLVNHACSGGVTADLTAPRQMDPVSRLEPTPPGVSTTAEADADLARRDPCDTGAFPDEELWTYRATAVNALVTAYDCTRHLRPQADFVDADVDLVLLTMGGNDAGFTSIVTSCFVPVTRSSSACRDRVEAARAQLPTIQQRLLTGVAALRAAGLRDDARIVQLGYPWLQVDNDFTLPDPPGYPAGDEVRALVTEGNAAIAAIVPRANAQHPGQLSFLAGVPETFSGHEPDATTPVGNPDRWINQAGDGIPVEVWYHPNRSGHAAYAEMLRARGTFGATTGPGTVTAGTEPAVRATLRVRLRPHRTEVGDRVRLRLMVRRSDGSRPLGSIVVRDVTHHRRLVTTRVRRADDGRLRITLRPRTAGRTALRIVYRDRTAPVVRATRRLRVAP